MSCSDSGSHRKSIAKHTHKARKWRVIEFIMHYQDDIVLDGTPANNYCVDESELEGINNIRILPLTDTKKTLVANLHYSLTKQDYDFSLINERYQTLLELEDGIEKFVIAKLNF